MATSTPAVKTTKLVVKYPKSIGQMVDFVETLQEDAAAIKAQLEAKQGEISAAITHLEANFDAADLNGAKGSLAMAERKSSIVYNAKDWDAIYAFIKKNNAFELLHKRLTGTACAERAEAGKPVPGVESVTLWKTIVKPIAKRGA